MSRERQVRRLSALHPAACCEKEPEIADRGTPWKIGECRGRADLHRWPAGFRPLIETAGWWCHPAAFEL
jgi:hypothetical protein